QAQPEDSNELFQKLLEDLKELPEYDNSPSRDRSIFFNNNEDHSVQNKEYLENSSNEIASSNYDQEKEKPPQDSNIRQLIREECCVEDLIESALNYKLLSINSNSQHLDKKEQKVKNVVEQPAERGTRVEKSLQNFRVIHKRSISLNKTSQISPVHAVAPILSTKEPEHSLSMRYEHLSITHETESDKVTKSNAKNLLAVNLVKCWSFNVLEPCIIYGNYSKLSGPKCRAKCPLYWLGPSMKAQAKPAHLFFLL
nr:hypothetical protein [Tanacetum cinerariifolium]